MAARGGGGIPRSPRSNRNNDPVPPLPAAAEAGSISMGLAGAKPGALPSSPAKVLIVALHPNNKIATAMMEEEGGGSSAMMATADDDGGRGDHHPSRCRWRLDVVLPSSTLPPSCNDSGLRGAQKPIARMPLPMLLCQQEVLRQMPRHPAGGRRRRRRRQRRQ